LLTTASENGAENIERAFWGCNWSKGRNEGSSVLSMFGGQKNNGTYEKLKMKKLI